MSKNEELNIDEDFNEFDYEGLDHPLCPSCGEEVSDIHNGGDPAAWWNNDNIPDGDVKHKCRECSQVFRINISWSPTFAVIPIEHDSDYDFDYSSLGEA